MGTRVTREGRPGVGVGVDRARREPPLIGVDVHQQRHGDLPHVAGTLDLRCLPAGALERGQEDRDENRNDPDDDQEFDQGNATSARGENGTRHVRILSNLPQRCSPSAPLHAEVRRGLPIVITIPYP